MGVIPKDINHTQELSKITQTQKHWPRKLKGYQSGCHKINTVGINFQPSRNQRQRENLAIIWGEEGGLIFRKTRVRITTDFSLVYVSEKKKRELNEIVKVFKKDK